MRKQNLLHFRPLGSREARLIHRMQRRLFPRELTEPLVEVADILRNTEEYMLCNLSFGLFDDTRMIGYVFAYVETESVFYDRPEEVVYLKEFCLLPGYESQLRPMLFKLYDLWHAFTPGMPLEAHVLSETLEKWRRLVRLLAYFGVTLTDAAEVRQPGRPPYQLLRLNVDPSAADRAEQPKPLADERWYSRNGVGVALIRDPRKWLSLRGDWDRLLATTGDSNVFQAFDYLWHWWKYYGSWNDLRVFVLTDGDRVIGVIPLMVEYFEILNRAMRKLTFITTPMDMNRPKLLFGDAADRCLPAFLEWLRAHAADWDILDIDEQKPDATTDEIHEFFGKMGCLIARSETICPYLPLVGTWDEFLTGRSRKMRSNVNRLRRRISDRGEIVIRRITSGPDIESAIDSHCEIEAQSWKAEKNLHLSGDKSHYFFHKSLARVFGAKGAFQLRRLECAGKPVASTYGIEHEGVFHSMKIAHDQAYDACSPGTVLESFELEDLFGSGLARYEFMGSFLANKLRWTSDVHRTVNVHIYQRCVRLSIFFFVFFILKRKVKAVLKSSGQFERVDSLLKRFGKSPFPRY